jgi:hypothetical protein
MVDNQYRGKSFPGIALEENIFMGHLPLNALIHYGLKRPSLVEKATKKDLQSDPHLLAAFNVRSQVQRRFDAARKKRAIAFSDYLLQLHTGERIGGYPVITLYSPETGDLIDDGRTLILKYSAPLVNLDGETQTEARFIMLGEEEDSGDRPVGFLLYHGITEEHAGVIMHDLNFYAKPVAEQRISILNTSGHLTKIVNEVVRELNIPSDMIARLTPRPKKKQLVSYPSMIAGAAGALVGHTITNSLPTFISKLNNYPNGADAGKARPFLEHSLKSVHEIGQCKPVIWALAGGYYHDTNKVLVPEDWLKLANAYDEAKFPRGTPHQAQLKRDAAFEAIGVKIGA